MPTVSKPCAMIDVQYAQQYWDNVDALSRGEKESFELTTYLPG